MSSLWLGILLGIGIGLIGGALVAWVKRQVLGSKGDDTTTK